MVSLTELDYRVPLYKQVEALLREKIDSQEYLPGQKIPSERLLAQHYKVNRMTVKRAIDSLVTDNLLTREQGKGTFVKGGLDKRFDITFQSSKSLTNVLSSKDNNIINHVLKFIDNIDSDFLRAKLNLSQQEEISGVHRIKLKNNIPFAVEYSYVPSKMFPDFYDIDFNNVGLYDYMGSKEHAPTFFQSYQIIMNPLPKEAKLLQVDPQSFVFKSDYLSADENHEIIEYTESYTNASIGKITSRLSL